MIHQHVTTANHVKYALELLLGEGSIRQQAFLGPTKGRRQPTTVGRIPQPGLRGGCEAKQIIQAQGTTDAIEIFLLNSHTCHQLIHNSLGHVLIHLKAHHPAFQTALAQAGFNGLQ